MRHLFLQLLYLQSLTNAFSPNMILYGREKMKKIFYLLLSILLISGCSGNQETATLNVTVEGNGTVVAYPKTGEIPLGETLLLIPKPERGWEFSEWTRNGNKLTDKDELVFILDDDCSVNAKFIQQAEKNATLNYLLTSQKIIPQLPSSAPSNFS
jgi:hypothetical protein